MKKVLFVLLLSFASPSALFAQQNLSTYEGVWQDVQYPNHYYSIHINDAQDRMVLVDMPGIEQSGVTLKSAYHGPITPALNGGGYLEARVRALQEAVGIPYGAYMALTSPTDLYISWSCPKGTEVCTADVRHIRKIF